MSARCSTSRPCIRPWEMWKRPNGRYREILQVSPDDADTLSNLGNVLQLRGDMDEAEILYQKVHRNAPG